jgi:hypothetical protein
MAKSTGTVPVLACSRGFCALGLWLRKPTTTPHQTHWLAAARCYFGREESGLGAGDQREDGLGEQGSL